MNKGFFSGVRRNTRSAADQGLNPDDVAFVPAEDEPLSVRPVLYGFKPPHSRFRKTTEPGLQRRYPTDALLSPPASVYPFSGGAPASPTTIQFGNGLWIASVGATIRTSTNAVTWVTQTSNFGTTTIREFAYGNNLWTAVGDSGQIRTSTDAVTWVTQTSNFGASSIHTVTYGNGLWVAGGLGGQIRSSTDGVTWVTRTSTHHATVTSVLFNDGMWLAGGQTNLITDNRVSTSTDLVTWVSRTVASSSLSRVVLLYSRQGYYMAVDADSSARLSSDGITWVTIANGGSGAQPVKAATLNGLTVVPQFSSGAIRISTDGINYSSVIYGVSSWSTAGSSDSEIIAINTTGEVLKLTPTVGRGATSVSSLYNEWYVQ